MRPVVRYSEAFKMKVVGELEAGRFKSAWEASNAYGVKGTTTVTKWLKRYGRNDLLGKVVWIMKADEQTEVKELRKRVRELEKALANAHLDSKLDAEYLKIACRRAGISDVEDFKKKQDGKL